VKALDTPVLLDILRGGPAARVFLKAVGPEELATTEINLWELGVLAVQDRSRGSEARLTALERVRRKLLVLPVDPASTRAAIRLRSKGPPGRPPRSELIAGVLEAHGVSEWVVLPGTWPGPPPSGVKLIEYGRRAVKGR
jgi:predicted nucleic acid-binding protein